MKEIVEVLKEFNDNIDRFTREMEQVKGTSKLIDEAMRREFEQQKKRAEKLLNQIKP